MSLGSKLNAEVPVMLTIHDRWMHAYTRARKLIKKKKSNEDGCNIMHQYHQTYMCVCVSSISGCGEGRNGTIKVINLCFAF